MAKITGDDILRIALANPDMVVPMSAKEPKTPARKAVTLWRNEREFQAAVFNAAAWEAINKPEYRLLFHVPNENAHKQPGVRGGVPDLFLAVPRGNHGGLFVELKVGANKPSQKQLDTMADLRAAGYVCHVVWDSVDEVMQVINSYLLIQR